jgi:hypothetical protein
MCMGYNKAVVSVRHPPFPFSHRAAAATVVLLLVIILTHNPEIRSTALPALFGKYHRDGF